MKRSRNQKSAAPTRKEGDKNDTPDPDHLDWVIHGRARSQIAALKICALMKDYPNEIRTKRLATQIQRLAAVAFSLWRAVFLADRTGRIDAKMADAEKFLGKMLTDNAIAFAQDRSAREWTFNYYVDNAYYRLAIFQDKRPAFKAVKLEPPIGRLTATTRWDYLQKALEKAIDLISNELKNSN
jgi:hypothetical protein